MSNQNAKLEFESGVTPYAMGLLTDSGDQTTFTSSASLFSKMTSYEPVIRVNGLLTGGAVIPAVSGTNNYVDVAALTCFLAGVLTSVSADTDVAITRPATAVSKVNSITVNNSGAIAVVAGTDGGTTAFSETRGAAGGPPYIPTTSIEIAQVRVISNTSAPITADQIYSVIGTHREKADFPVYDIDYATGTLTFNSALPKIHTGDVPKRIYASYAEPVFTEQHFANDFVPCEKTHSTSSEQVYNDTVGSTASSLNQGSFTAILNDGITDEILTKKDEWLWFRFYQDRYKTPYILTQGKLGISRTFGASDNPKISCTISPSFSSVERVV